MSAPRVDYFYSFRSPYSYLSGPRGFALADEFEIDLRFRGVIPMMMRGESVPTAKRLHTMRDVKREADRLGMPFGRIHDPLGEGATRTLAVSEYAIVAGNLGRGNRSSERRGATTYLRKRRARLGRLQRCAERPSNRRPS